MMACVAAVVPTGVSAKVKLAGDKRLTAGTTPVPLRSTVCADPAALSAMLRVAFNGPEVTGVKVTVIVQLAPIARFVPHWLL